MSSEREPNGLGRLRSRILAGVGKAPAMLVVTAAAVTVPLVAEAAPPSDPARVQADVASLHIKSHVSSAERAADGTAAVAKQWWQNGWVRPWANWNNWHNWPNWNNWHNFGGWR